jgi:hypothetical protein
VERRYSAQAMALSFSELYRQILAGKRRAGAGEHRRP